MGKRKNELVKKSNSLVRSSWVMDSIWEARLVALVASKTRIDDIDFKEHEIPISEILEGAGKQSSGQIYKIVEDAARTLIRKVITVREPNGCIVIAGVFAQCKIDPGTGIIKVVFADGLKNHYLQLKEKFTQYKLEEFLRLPSTYSQRLFEILTSWKSVPEGEITILMSELHEQLDTSPALKKNFKDFRVRVLEQAQKDILDNPDSSLDYEWEAVKEGRKVVAVRFIFDRRKVAAEREEKRKEEDTKRMRRAADIVRAASRCYAERSVLSADEQARRELHPEPEVCEYCKKSNLPIPNCQRFKRAEVIE